MALLWGLSSCSTAPRATRWWGPACSPVSGSRVSPSGLQQPLCASVRPISPTVCSFLGWVGPDPSMWASGAPLERHGGCEHLASWWGPDLGVGDWPAPLGLHVHLWTRAVVAGMSPTLPLTWPVTSKRLLVLSTLEILLFVRQETTFVPLRHSFRHAHCIR